MESSAIAAVTYDEQRQHLDVELESGRAYRYLDVPSRAYEALMAAESKGRYYNDEIRDEYEYIRLR